MKALPTHRKQKGAVLILVTVALFTLLGFAALALDGGYLLLNKSRLQDAVDAAALSGAKTLSKKPADIKVDRLTDAEGAVLETLRETFKGSGFRQINIDTDNLSEAVKIEFSEEATPFLHNPIESSRFIRVSLSSVPVTQFFSQILISKWQAGATAIAGPDIGLNKEDNKVIPLLLCAKDPSDMAEDGSFGFKESTEEEQGDVIVIKTSHHKNAPVGGGNFLGLALEGSGADIFRDALAGDLTDKSVVTVGESVPTKPGNMVGPSLGLNTRLDEFKSPLSAPEGPASEGGSEAFYPDCSQPLPSAITFDDEDFGDPKSAVSGNIALSEGAKKEHLQSYPEYFNGENVKYPKPSNCVENRRIVKVPLGNCNPGCNGDCDIPVVGVACMFLNQKVTGNGSNQYIVAEKIAGCGLGGALPGNSTTFKLVLYKNTNGDS